MKALLIIWLWNQGELALTSIELPSKAICEIVKVETLEAMNATKTLRGLNRGAHGLCIEVPSNG